MSEDTRQAIVVRLDAIREWRVERELQDMIGLGSDAAERSRRSAAGIAELSRAIANLPKNDPRIIELRSLAFSGFRFDPGALLLNELGRFRFHDPEQSADQFVDTMVELARQDAEEMGRWGGPQLAGDNPWRASWTVAIDPDDDEW